MCVRKITWSSHSCRPIDWQVQSPSFTLVHGYCWLSYKQKNQLQPMVGYRQTRNLLPGMSQSRREKTTTNRRYLWQFKYVNTMLIVLCMNNGLICAYITGIHDKRIVISCTTWHLSQTIGIFWLLSSILSADYFTIIYGANSL